MSKINVPAEFLTDYANYVKSDYVKWWGKERSSETVVKMINEFNVAFEVGSAYIKVVKTKNGVTQSVHSFISNKNGKFPLGTILKAASFKAPATNFARGNLLNKETWDRVQWTGVS